MGRVTEISDHGPVRRRPVAQVVSLDRWDQAADDVTRHAAGLPAR